MSKTNPYLALAALASACLPNKNIVATSAPQYNNDEYVCTNIADSNGHHYTVMSPKTTSSAVNLERHATILSYLNSLEDFPIATMVPRVSYPLSSSAKVFIFDAIERGYPLQDTDLMTSTRFASTIAKALVNLHSIDTNISSLITLPSYTPADIQNRLLADLDEAMQTRKLPKVLFSRWEEQIENVSLWKFTPTVVHANLSADSFYVHNYVVTGMADFSALHVGDPAQDFAWLFGVCSDETLNRIFKIYNYLNPQLDLDVFFTRAKLHSELMLLKWLLHGIHSSDNDIVEDASAMLNDLAESIQAENEAIASATQEQKRIELENQRILAEIEQRNKERMASLTGADTSGAQSSSATAQKLHTSTSATSEQVESVADNTSATATTDSTANSTAESTTDETTVLQVNSFATDEEVEAVTEAIDVSGEAESKADPQ